MPFDVFIIGGGINGCGVARDATGRGLSVCLAEKGDLGGATSSGSSKLIHGGLRYLEYYDFKLVRKSLREREVLWKIAPHIIYPLRFVLPHHSALRSPWLLRLGLFLYDHIGGRKLLPGTRRVNLAQDQTGKPLESSYTLGFEYADCWVDDARLVVLNARDAADHGAQIHTRTEVIGAHQEDGSWHITTRGADGKTNSFSAKVLVNASGPWVYGTSQELLGTTQVYKPRLVRGSHIVVPRLYEHNRCYILQNADGRIVFVIPYEETFTLIGTTERDHGPDLENVSIENDETVYLCESVNNYLKEPIGPRDVVWSYSAVRPLFDDGSSEAKSITRDYRIVTESENGTPPMISILGGKITTYRTLAEEVVQEIGRFVPVTKSSWTGRSALPGGDFPHDEYHRQVEDLHRDYAFLDAQHTRRLVRLYGTLSRQILQDAKRSDDLGKRFGSDLYEAEVRYLVEREWASCAEDILWRRTKEGLRFSDEEVGSLEDYVGGKVTRL